MLDLDALLSRLDSLGISIEEVVDASRHSSQASPPYVSSGDWMLFSILEAAAKVDSPAVGLRLGRFWKGDLAIYHRSKRQCRSLAEANRAVKRHLSSSQQLQFYSDAVKEREWRMAFATRFPPSATSVILLDEIMARSKHELEYLIGDELSIKRVEMSSPAPRYKAVYEDFFQCPVIWGRPHQAIVIDENYLHRPCIALSADPIETPSPNPLQGSDSPEPSHDLLPIASAIMELLVFSPGRYPSLHRVAEKFEVSPSTVKRRLLRNASTYRDIVDEVRRSHVAQYLGFTQLAPKEIAHRLGFTNVHNFRRAFSRWMGQTPNQYRQAVRHAAPGL